MIAHANDIELDLSGFTIAQAVEALADQKNYDPLDVAVYLDRQRVWDWERVVFHAGAAVEFMREWGRKGGQQGTVGCATNKQKQTAKA